MPFELTLTYLLLLPLLGALVGMIGALTGLGGGFILVPLLIFMFPDASPATITSISLTVVFMNALSATLGNLRARRLDLRTALLVAAGAVPGAVVGALVGGLIGRDSFEIAFGLMLSLGAVYILWRSFKVVPNNPLTVSQINRYIRERTGDTHQFHVNELLAVAISPLSGFLSAFFGIGGGVINVPSMIFLLKIPPRIAAATSLLIQVPTSFTGVSTHIVTGQYHEGWRRAGLLGLGALLGAQLGLYLAPRINPRIPLRIIAVALAIVSVRQILAGLG